MSRLAVLRDRAPHLAVTWTTAAGLALVAPLEHAAGLALHLGWWHAWTLTALIEGAAGSAILAGRLVPAALALTGSSVLLGTLQSAGALPSSDPVVLAVGVTLLAVASLLLVHRVRAGVQRARSVEAARRAERDRAEADAEHERHLSALAVAEQATEAEHRRAMERDRGARFAEQDRARAELELERARAAREQTRADAEQTRALAERERADAELAEQMRADRDFAREQWLEHRWPSPQLAGMLGVADSRARALIAEWRSLHAV